MLADFTYSCLDLRCSFMNASTHDSELTATSAWEFGDGDTSTATDPQHTYDADGTYEVTLTVTDSKGQTDSATQQVTVALPTEPDQPDAPDEPTAGITLEVSVYKVKGVHHADLVWDGATTDEVDIVRDGSTVATTANDGSYTDNIGNKGGGSYTYKVCEAGSTQACSAPVTAAF